MGGTQNPRQYYGHRWIDEGGHLTDDGKTVLLAVLILLAPAALGLVLWLVS
jgi:hypothetical protein